MKPSVPTNSKRRGALLGAVALGALAMVGVTQSSVIPAFAQAVTQSQGQVAPSPAAVPSFADLVERVGPAVVSVRVKGAQVKTAAARQTNPDFGVPDGLQEFFERFRGPGQPGPQPGQPRSKASQGSGFFISADGFLVTNNHVVENATEVEVLMDSGQTLAAKVIGQDSKTDLALLKVSSGGPFKFVELAAEAPRVGDWVLAVGNPFGLGGSVTAGIVSARGRDIGAGPYDDFLQIDASVNRGNSGGPAFNLRGQVIGVNTAIYSPSGGNVGIAFAIPAPTVQQIVTQLKEKGSVARGFLGVNIQSLTKDIAASLSLDKAEGAIVANVEDSSPAAKAGILAGDVVLSVNRNEVKDARDLSRTIAFMNPGETAKISVWRKGDVHELVVRISKQPGGERASAGAKEVGPAGLGLSLSQSSKGDGKGVEIVGVEQGSLAAEKGFSPGQTILDVAGKPVKTPSDVKQALEAAHESGKTTVLFRVQADGGARFIAVPVKQG